MVSRYSGGFLCVFFYFPLSLISYPHSFNSCLKDKSEYHLVTCQCLQPEYFSSCGRQNSKDIPMTPIPLVIQSNHCLDTGGWNFADVIKVTNQLTLKQGDYLGFSRWAHCNYMNPLKAKEEIEEKARGIQGMVTPYVLSGLKMEEAMQEAGEEFCQQPVSLDQDTEPQRRIAALAGTLVLAW